MTPRKFRYRSHINTVFIALNDDVKPDVTSKPLVPPYRSSRDTFKIAFFRALFLPFLFQIASAQTAPSSPPPPDFTQLLKTMASAPYDDCQPGPDLTSTENELFQAADNEIIHALTSHAQVQNTLVRLNLQSENINRTWPPENRFRASALDITPLLVVKMTYRNRATFSVFVAQDNGHWRKAEAFDDGRDKPAGGYNWLDLYPLFRGPSKRARFLAKFGHAGCGSGVGVSYYAFEWNPGETAELTEIITLQGAVSQDPDSKSLAPVGALHTIGHDIDLPYCWFSALDTWDNPTLCALDSYDLSGDRPRFTGIKYNRPDLVPIAKVIQYAGARDYPAVLAYCDSPEVARQIVSVGPPFVLPEDDLKIERLTSSKERVTFVAEPQVIFEVTRKPDNRWLVLSYQVK